MIHVSNAWANAQKQTLLPEMFVEITYMITNPGVQEIATVSANYPEEFSDVGQVIVAEDKHTEKYATLDYGCWGLDGSFGWFDSSPIDPGYVDKNYSGEDGRMGINPYPKISIDFEMRQDLALPGLTITWDKVFGGWATDFVVSAYDANGMIARKEVTGNTSPKSVVWVDMTEYTNITVEIVKWSHPFQRPRCLEILLGVQQIYTKDDLLQYEHSQTVDLLSASLPENKITFHLRNDDGRWNPDNPEGSEKYLTEQQEMVVRYGMDIDGTTEWIKGGTFWLSERSTPSNGMEVVFTARDGIEFMKNTYQGTLTGTLYDIATAAFIEADLPIRGDGVPRYFIHESLKDISTEFSEREYSYTVAEVLQMVANAGTCVFYQDRDGILRIEPWKEVYSNYLIDPSISYSHPEYTMSKPLKAVSVGYGDELRAEVAVGVRGEIQTVDNPLIDSEEDALRVAETTKEVLKNRRVVEGDFRADLRVDALDNVVVTSKYASNVVAITAITYSTTGGSFKGSYTGRVVSISMKPEEAYVNEYYVGELW